LNKTHKRERERQRGKKNIYYKREKFLKLGKTITNFCSSKKLVQATRFFGSSPIFPASPSKTCLCIDTAVPHKNVFSLESSRILNNFWEDIGKLEGLD
jgi:hypothetical protein